MTLRDELAAALHGNVVLVGIGNEMRGDDAAGSLVARQLKGHPGLTVIDAEEVPENHLGRIIEARPELVLLVDSVNLGAPAGALALIEKQDLWAYVPTTHRTPLGLVMNYLEGETGARVLILAIQPATVALGARMCDEVCATVDLLVGMIAQCMHDQGMHHGVPA